MSELKTQIEQIAAEENKSEVEIITALQAGAAKLGDEDTLSNLCELKREYV